MQYEPANDVAGESSSVATSRPRITAGLQPRLSKSRADTPAVLISCASTAFRQDESS
jgi:hypothetical protein